MIDIHKLCRGTGYLIVESDHDTTNIVCKRGHIYADGKCLVAAIDGATKGESRKLRSIGEPVMDGDFGELSVRFHPSRLGEAARILKPRQARKSKLAA